MDSVNLETLLTGLLVATAGLYLVRTGWRYAASLRATAAGAGGRCGGCSACGSQTRKRPTAL